MATRTADLHLRRDPGADVSVDHADPAATACFHCGEPVPPGCDFSAPVLGTMRPMCCIGCAAAAAAIADCGLDDYYRLRDARAQRPQDGPERAALAVYDDPLVREHYVSRDAAGCTATLAVGGMTCAACAWLLEQRLGRLDGVEAFEVSLALGRARIRWNPAETGLAPVLAAGADLGFTLRPYSGDARREAEAADGRDLLRRLGVAAVCGVQVMMLSLALYFADGMAAAMQTFMRYAALVLTLPLIGWCALPFLRGAARALRARAVSMDVPVSLALLMAFAGSCWHTLTQAGDVYFDSVAMFVVLLLGSRYLELRARVDAGHRLDDVGELLPPAATRLDAAGRPQTLAMQRLAVGDRLWVRAGEVIAADGVVEAGVSTVDESLQSGESQPRRRAAGARVIAGSVNLDAPLTVRVTAVAGDSFAGQLSALVARAAGSRARELHEAGALAQVFVAAVLLLAVATALFWAWVDPSRWFEATLAVLVVSCPCALAIARPAALAAAHAGLLAQGVAVVGAGALERLAGVREVLFDKTGTLTHGVLELASVRCFEAAGQETALALARGLAEAADHPLTRALRDAAATPALPLGELVAEPGRGARARHGDDVVCLGSREFVAAVAGEAAFAGVNAHPGDDADDGAKEAWLARGSTLLARFAFRDRLRADAPAVVGWLRARGLPVAIVSGDRDAVVAAVAASCGIEDWHAALSPADKLDQVARRDAALMVGDGLNDAPVMAAASVSMAVAGAADAARQQADILLFGGDLGGDLGGVRRALATSRRMLRIVRQNHAWAIGYNLCAVPLAAAGWLPPWAAALGMSLSSLAVVGNALRARTGAAD